MDSARNSARKFSPMGMPPPERAHRRSEVRDWTVRITVEWIQLMHCYELGDLEGCQDVTRRLGLLGVEVRIRGAFVTSAKTPHSRRKGASRAD